MAMKKLYINDVSIAQYGIYISSDTVLNAPSFDYTEHQVPGRDGTLLQYNNRLNNVVRRFTCHIPSRLNVSSGIAALKRLLYLNPGYVKLSSDYEPSAYQYGYLAQEFNVTPFNMYRTATFDLYFSCLPQKYYTTQAQTISGALFSDIRCILTRNNGFIKKVLDGIPEAYIPSDTSFFVIGKQATSVSAGSITLSASWSEGNTFAAVAVGNSFPNEEADCLEVLAYTNTSLSSYSATSTKNGRIWFIVPVRTSGTYTVQFNSTTITTPSLASATDTVSNADAMGATMKVEVSYGVEPVDGEFYPNALVLKYYNGTEELGDCVIVWRTDLMTAEMRSTILNEYAYDEGGIYTFDVSIDMRNNSTYIVRSGKPDLPFDGFMEISGAIPSVGISKVEGLIFKNNTIGQGRITADWWGL